MPIPSRTTLTRTRLNGARRQSPVPLLLLFVFIAPHKAMPQATSVRDADAVCAPCHESIFCKYLATPMANASGLASEKLKPATFEHQPSGVTYDISLTQGNAILAYRDQHETGPTAQLPLSYFLGSGHLGITYLYFVDDYLFESPVAWYATSQSYDMKPGLAEMRQRPPGLPMQSSCLRCHMSAVQPSDPGTINRYQGVPFLHTGITCEARHGDSTQHVRSRGKAGIVNPARLNADRRDSVCISCHLEGDTLVERAGHSALNYRPGESISTYIAYYVRGGASLTARGVSEVEQLGQQPADPLAEAHSLLAAGALAKSEDLLHRYIAGHPDSADAHFLLGYVLFREQRPVDSLAEFTAGARTRRPKVDELKAVASDYVLLRDYADADKWFSEVTAEEPKDADAWYLLGRTKYNENEFAEAASSFERALTLRGKFIEAENNLGLAWRELNSLDKAKTAFQTAIEWQGDNPTDSQPFLNLGTLLAEQSDFDKSIPNLVKAASLSPDNPKIHEELGKVYEAQKNLPKAQAELEKAAALAPNTSALHFKLGQVYRLEGLRDQAQHEFDLCDKLNSTHSSTNTPNPFTPDPGAPH